MEIGNRYKLLDELGKGGMGTVYRGLDTASKQVVAIKELNPLLTTPELIERFKREGEALRELNHPNIVKLLDTVEHNGAYYLVMEYVSGGDLHALLKTGQLPIERCLKLALDLADALTRAHKLDIIHRDLKPANVLLAEDGTLRLSDFGVARMGQRERVTATDVIVGTVDYLAPEALDGAGIDSRADIWAFGAMLFEMVAGKRPFTGESLTATLTAILTHPVPDLESLRPDAPIALIDLVYRMLEKEREARIRSVRQVGLELEDILQGRTTQTPPETRFAPPTPDFLQRPKHNLPAQTTPFVGREAELAELAKLLDNPKIRLITIVAQGGMGKTRLALEIGEQYVSSLQPEASGRGFKDGVYFVELAPLSDAANIVSAIAEAVSYQFQADGREQKQQILDFLSNKNLLLVLDNYEHLLEGANLVTDILKAAPHVKVLATSRQRLNQSGETLFNLEGMDFPAWEAPEDALEYAAVKLFMQSAKRAKPDFELTVDNMDAIARICKLVQGLPLGIVLAAAWLPMLSPNEIAAEITKSIDFLVSDMGDIPARQQSIRAVFDYSWDLLTDNEKQAFMKLSVFRGGFTREAAEAVAGANLRTLMSLMNKSLLRRDAESGRYEIHELLRQYAENNIMENSEAFAQNKNNHCAWYAIYCQKIYTRIREGQVKAAIQSVATDIENIRTGWYWAEAQTQYDKLWQYLPALYWYAWLQNRTEEVEIMFAQVTDKLENERSSEFNELLLSLLALRAWMQQLQDVFGMLHQLVQKLVEQSLLLLPSLNYSQLYPQTTIATSWLGFITAWVLDNPERGVEICNQGIAICRAKQFQFELGLSLVILGFAYANRGEFTLAAPIFEEVNKIAEELQHPHLLAAVNLFHGSAAFEQNDLTRAESLLQKAVKLNADVGDWWNGASARFILGTIALKVGRYHEAGRWYLSILQYANDTSSAYQLALVEIVKTLLAQGRQERVIEISAATLNYLKVADTTKDELQSILGSLEDELSASVYLSAWERGKSLNLEIVLKELFVEFGKDA